MFSLDRTEKPKGKNGENPNCRTNKNVRHKRIVRRRSSVGQSSGFIARRSPVRVRTPLVSHPVAHPRVWSRFFPVCRVLRRSADPATSLSPTHGIAPLRAVSRPNCRAYCGGDNRAAFPRACTFAADRSQAPALRNIVRQPRQRVPCHRGATVPPIAYRRRKLWSVPADHSSWHGGQTSWFPSPCDQSTSSAMVTNWTFSCVA